MAGYYADRNPDPIPDTYEVVELGVLTVMRVIEVLEWCLAEPQLVERGVMLDGDLSTSTATALLSDAMGVAAARRLGLTMTISGLNQIHHVNSIGEMKLYRTKLGFADARDAIACALLFQ